MVVDDVLGGRESGLVALRGKWARQRERGQQSRREDPCCFGTPQAAANYVRFASCPNFRQGDSDLLLSRASLGMELYR